MGMEAVKLSKPWLDHAAKETVQVDPLRARWLRENGYSAATAPPELVLPPLAPELQSPFPGIEITAPNQPSDAPTAASEGDTPADETPADPVPVHDRRRRKGEGD